LNPQVFPCRDWLSTGIPMSWLIADMIILHSLVETYIFSFSFLLLFLRLLPCMLTTMLSTPSLSFAASVMITHTWCMLL
jgi:ethanolamine transporter EutH